MADSSSFGLGWFNDLKKTRGDFRDVNNLIDLVKFRYERDLDIPKWLIGLGVAILFSGGTMGSINGLDNFFKNYALFFLIISATLLVGGLYKLFALNNRHKRAMSYLYRERDKGFPS